MISFGSSSPVPSNTFSIRRFQRPTFSSSTLRNNLACASIPNCIDSVLHIRLRYTASHTSSFCSNSKVTPGPVTKLQQVKMYPNCVRSVSTVGDSPLLTLACILFCSEVEEPSRAEHVRQLPLRHSFGMYEIAREDVSLSSSLHTPSSTTPEECCGWMDILFDDDVDCRSRACRIGSPFRTNIVEVCP